MNNEIKKLIEAEISRGKSMVIYMMLGKFGDRIPSDVAEEMRELAEDEMEMCHNKRKKVGKNLS